MVIRDELRMQIDRKRSTISPEPGVDTLGKPQSNLTLGVLDTVRAVADVSADVNGEVAANRARGRIGRFGCAKHHTSRLDSTHSLPHHAAHGAAGHVLDQTSEKTLAGQISIVLFEEITGGGVKLKSLQLEPLLLETGDNLTDEATLHTVRLQLKKIKMSVRYCIFFAQTRASKFSHHL